MTRLFPHLGGYYNVPDEENKKRSSLFVIAALIWPLSTTLKTLTLSWCYHSKLSQILFGDLEVQTVPDKKKNVIDVIKDGKDTIFPSQDQARRPGVIHLTSRTRRPRCDISTNIVMYLQILSISRCVTCSGQKCLHVNIFVEEAKQRRETDNLRERQKEKTKSKNRETTEVVGDHQLPFEPTEQGDRTHNSWQSKWA